MFAATGKTSCGEGNDTARLCLVRCQTMVGIPLNLPSTTYLIFDIQVPFEESLVFLNCDSDGQTL